MAGNFQAIADIAARAAEVAGKPVTLRKVSINTYDTATGTASQTRTDVPTCAVIEDFRSHELTESIRAGDLKLSADQLARLTEASDAFHHAKA